MNAYQTTMLAGASILSMCAAMAFADAIISKIRQMWFITRLGDGQKVSLLDVLLNRGIAPLIPLSLKLMDRVAPIRDSVESATLLLSECGRRVKGEILLSDLLGAAIAAFVAGSLIGGSIVFGMAVGCIVFIGILSFAHNRFERQNIDMREEIPEALRTLAMLFRSGHSLPQALHDSSCECKGYLRHLFSVASDRMDMGATPKEALSVMRGNPRAPELSFVAVALDIQHQSGGRIALVLESAMDSIEGELKLARSLRVQTAQAKLSASIVTIMPFVLIALFSLFSPDFLSPFFSSVLGMAVLAVALVMQLSGVLIVRRMLNVDGGR